mmetsp:Transcript_15768/g.54811  ORF Transcript_15768/g.54811 Transcript_15768/m.54811 type:complete len:154 (+) Transcript_15768:1461-1922(+)
MAEAVPYRAVIDAIEPDAARTRKDTASSGIARQLTAYHPALLREGEGAAHPTHVNRAGKLDGGGDGDGDGDWRREAAYQRMRDANMHALYPKTGFTDKQIFSDMRFKISHALRSAGLHDSDYARSIMHTLARPGAMTQATQAGPFGKVLGPLS